MAAGTTANELISSAGNRGASSSVRSLQLLSVLSLATCVGALFVVADNTSLVLGQLLLAVAMLVTGAAGYLAFSDRARREHAADRSSAFRWLALCFVALYALPGLGLLIGVVMGVAVRHEVVEVALLVAAPIYVIGLTRVRTHLTISPYERRIAVIDAAIALLCFIALFAQIGQDEFAMSNYPGFSIAVMGAEAIGAAATVWLVSRNRFFPMLPARQLALWVSWVVLFLISDVIAREMGDAQTGFSLTVVVVGTSVAGWCAVAAAARPVDEIETKSDARIRSRGARLAPLVAPFITVTVFVIAVISGSPISTLASVCGLLAFGLIIGLLVVLRDLSGSEYEELASGSARRVLTGSAGKPWFQALVRDFRDVVTVVDVRGTVVYQTPSVTRVLGHSADHWIASPVLDLVREDQRTALSAAMSAVARNPVSPLVLELSLVSGTSGFVATETTITSLIDELGPLSGYVLTSRDLTDRGDVYQRLAAQAATDLLTGLTNRTSLRRQTHDALAASALGQVAVISLDLDGFRSINDSLGHSAGDDLLKLAAQALLRSVRPWDVVARTGGDEFAILVIGDDAEQSVSRVMERVGRQLRSLLLPDGSVSRLSASAGYAINDRDSDTAEELLRNADLALARARTSPHLALLRFEYQMHEALLTRVKIENELRRALDEHQFVLHYQPIVWLPSRRIVGAEALLRWRHPERGLISAAEFIDLIEDVGLGPEVRTWVVERAAAALAAVMQEHSYDELFKLGFNVSGDQLDAGLIEVVRAALERSGAPADRFVIEVTETSLAVAESAGPVIQALRDMGLRVGVDDFGVGYSSLNYLSELPVDYIKVDRSFVTGIDSDVSKARLTDAILGLCEALSLQTIVEGVESEAELKVLYDSGCRYAQGWLFAKALPLVEVMDAMNMQAINLHLDPAQPPGARAVIA